MSSSAGGTRPGLTALALGALGVVYGDIGTSPIYTLREAFGHAGGLHISEREVLGVLSLIFWSIMLIVTLKYVAVILRMDNRGEGGVLAMTALALTGAGRSQRARRLIAGLSIAGLALFYGDGLITPAISVLSAIEGLEVAHEGFAPWVVPLSTIVLVALFLIQRFGTGRVGALFGPIVLLWFLTLGLLGLLEIIGHPGVLRALNPLYIEGLFALERWQAFVALGAIVLAVTGAEALYADLGHFGRIPIQAAWLGLVLPALLLNYFGQGALVIAAPEKVVQPFFLLAPSWLLYPLVGLATAATIIASQAVISGVFSLTQQAIRLGYLPRMPIRHTSASERGQIYIARVNVLLMLGVLALVWGFGSSSDLAAAYGISVTGVMAISSVLGALVAIWVWRWPKPVAFALFGAFLAVDLAYVAANTLKIPAGGWLTLAVALVFALIVVTWRRGRGLLWQRLYQDALPVATFLERLEPTIARAARTGVFMTGDPTTVPPTLLHNLKHNQTIHERVVLMQVETTEQPYVPPAERVQVERLGKGFFAVRARYGFMESPNVPAALEACRDHGLAIDPMLTSYFLGRETLIPSTAPDLGPLQERLFIALSASATSATAYFGIPPGQVVELGSQVEI